MNFNLMKLGIQIVSILALVSFILSGTQTLFNGVLALMPWVAVAAWLFVAVRLGMRTWAELRHVPAASNGGRVPSSPASPSPPPPPPSSTSPHPLPLLTTREDKTAVSLERARREAYDNAHAELNKMIGLDTVKQEINSFINEVKFARERRKMIGSNPPSISHHMIFAGPPGTGKTTVARLMGPILTGLGLLSKGHFIETNSTGLKGQYKGESEQKTKEILESAIGGVLFIDEAYALADPTDNSFGQNVIETMLIYMENYRTDLVVIAAGYDDKMRAFVRSNPGLPSRFTFTLHFDDYTLDELRLIFDQELQSQELILTPDAGPAVDQLIHDLYDRGKKIGHWANAREMRTLYSRIFPIIGERVLKLPTTTSADYQLVTAEDIAATRAVMMRLP
ncbi:AAA family ATPase [Telmatospirillum sp.]|uniref:AAA family ATPase n=1 Tax=Telmatospirillum sp. TaxID=2079197 RepID=UPI00284BD7D7|nr:AAA family ATPase [Telmatospirillum sp.]MDR3440607.1 AAA family ATPase [Telmatospirillum sp.]